MKRIIILATTILLIAGINSCTTSEKAKDTKELVFSFWGSPEQVKIDEEIIEKFKEQHPGVEIKTIHIPSQSRYNDKLLTMIAGGTPPDVMFVHLNAFPTYADSGKLLALDELVKRDLKKEIKDIYPLALKSFTYRGKLYAFPRDVSGWVMYYNKDLFDKAKIKYPDKSWTWKDFEEACKKLTKDTNGDGVKDVYGAIFPQYLPMILYAFGGKIFDNEEDPEKCVIGEYKENLEALRYAKRLFKEGAVAPMEIGSGVGTHEIFMSGKIGMYFTGKWKVPDFKKITKFKWDVAPVPKGKARRATRQSGSALAIAKNSKNRELAWEFVKYYTGKEGVKISTKSGRMTPIYKSLINSRLFLEQRPPEHVKYFADTMEYGITGTKFPKNGEVLYTLFNVFTMVIEGQLSEEEGIKRLQEELSRIVENYRAERGDK